MGKHFSHLTPTQRTQIDAFRRAGMKVVDIAKEVGVHYTTIYRELKRCTYEHLNSDYTTEIRYNPDGAQARYEANLRAKGPELKIGNDYELADYLIGKIRDEKYSPEAAIGEAEVMGWPFRVHICASTAYNYIRGEIFGDDLTVEMLPQHGKRRRKPERPEGAIPRKPAGKSIEKRPEIVNTRTTFGHWEMDSLESGKGYKRTWLMLTERKTRREIIVSMKDKTSESSGPSTASSGNWALYSRRSSSPSPATTAPSSRTLKASKTSAEGKENAPPSTTATHTRRASAAPTKTKTA